MKNEQQIEGLPASTEKVSEGVDFGRRRFLRNTALAVGAAQFGITVLTEAQPESVAPAKEPDMIRPFHVSFPEADLADLRQRVKATRWPERETVDDDSQGVQLATIQALAQYWATDYDWSKCEAKLNALPMFVTTIDGLDIQFIHVRSKHDNALPIILTHGWPGSIIEELKVIEPLTNPTAYGGSASDAFHVVIPSLPGYGFSGKPTTVWGVPRIARAWVTLMNRLGYAHFVAAGGDVGAQVGDELGVQAPPELLGVHSNMPGAVPPDINKAAFAGTPAPASFPVDEKRAYDQLTFFYKYGLGYANEMALRPQTLYGLADSPVGMASWMIDHDARSYEGISKLVVGGQPFGDITQDDILDNITLYWLTKTAVSSARLYWNARVTSKKGFFDVKGVGIPFAVSAFPDEIYTVPQGWAEKAYPKLIHYNKLPKGGHFAAWEQPELYTSELRASFQSLRS
jgi:pimeloyl-ACP methyl ester carboxylesterase